MRLTVYCIFIRYRSWTTVGHVFTARDERKATLRKLAVDEGEEMPDDATEHDLVELIGHHDHEVYLFDGVVAIGNRGRDARPRTTRPRRRPQE